MLQTHQKRPFPLNDMSVLNKSDAQDFLSSVKTHFLPGLKLFPHQHCSGMLSSFLAPCLGQILLFTVVAQLAVAPKACLYV